MNPTPVQLAGLTAAFFLGLVLGQAFANSMHRRRHRARSRKAAATKARKRADTAKDSPLRGEGTDISYLYSNQPDAPPTRGTPA